MADGILEEIQEKLSELSDKLDELNDTVNDLEGAGDPGVIAVAVADCLHEELSDELADNLADELSDQISDSLADRLTDALLIRLDQELMQRFMAGRHVMRVMDKDKNSVHLCMGGFKVEQDKRHNVHDVCVQERLTAWVKMGAYVTRKEAQAIVKRLSDAYEAGVSYIEI